jgi:hypothetical protein
VSNHWSLGVSLICLIRVIPFSDHLLKTVGFASPRFEPKHRRATAKYCHACATPIIHGLYPWFCESCGAMHIRAAANFCRDCGTARYPPPQGPGEATVS